MGPVRKQGHGSGVDLLFVRPLSDFTFVGGAAVEDGKEWLSFRAILPVRFFAGFVPRLAGILKVVVLFRSVGAIVTGSPHQFGQQFDIVGFDGIAAHVARAQRRGVPAGDDCRSRRRANRIIGPRVFVGDRPSS